jgi:hypothetical protein
MESRQRRVVAYCMSAEETLTYRAIPAVAGGETRIVSIDVATAKAEDVPAGPGINLKAIVSFSIGSIPARLPGRPDGSRNPDFELHRAPAAFPSFDPSGEHFVAGARPQELDIFDTATTPPRAIYKADGRNIAGTSWSPGGDSILFGVGAFNAFQFKGDFSNGRMDGGAQVAMIKPDGMGFQEVTSGANNNGSPSFAPDGKRFVCRTAGPEGQGLRIMDLETRKITTLTTEYDNFPIWSPRGDLIAFVRLFQGD